MSGRSRDLGIRIGALEPAPPDAITDVAGVSVGHRTIISDKGPLDVGRESVKLASSPRRSH
jgi:L-aminopeptidase/D-esterase-like protein